MPVNKKFVVVHVRGCVYFRNGKEYDKLPVVIKLRSLSKVDTRCLKKHPKYKLISVCDLDCINERWLAESINSAYDDKNYNFC